MKAYIGKVRGEGLIRTKHGIPRVKDMDALTPGLRALVTQEINAGLYTIADIELAQQKLEEIMT